MNKEPETYIELIRYKRCVDLTKYYNLTLKEVWKIYDFLTENVNGIIHGDLEKLILKINANDQMGLIIDAKCSTSNIKGIILSNKEFKLL